MTQSASVIALAAGAAVVAALLVAWLMRRLATAPILAQRLELERQFAAAEQRCQLIPEMQGALDRKDAAIAMLQGDKATAEQCAAANAEAVSGLKAVESDLRARLIVAEEASVSARQNAADLAARLATAQETIEQERRASAEKLALLGAAREQMTREFKLLADEVMKANSETFGRQNREQIGTILGPLREKLAEFHQGLQAAHTESVKERATLGEQIRQLSMDSARINVETQNLTRALKGNVKTQGAWGEMILASILERSGLRDGEEYVVQKSHTNEDGQRLRPDVILKMPQGLQVVVDSKVSLTAFEAYVNAETDEERGAHLTRHIASVRAHINTLGSKDYHTTVGSGLDYVIMFVPIEGALAAALQSEPKLTSEAADRNVAILTPTTLLVVLRTVVSVWQIERRNQNAESIARQAGNIYNKFVSFIGDMEELGKRLDGSRKYYGEAMGKLSTGNGNIVRQLEQLRHKGARVTKALPPELLERAEATLVMTEELPGLAAE